MQTKIDYLNTVLKSLKIVWYHKYLWVLGFFSAGIMLLNNLSPRFRINIQDSSLVNLDLKGFLSSVLDFFAGHPLRIAIGAFALTLIILVFVILGCLSQAGLICAVNQVVTKKKQKLNVRESLKVGSKFFWRTLSIDFLFGLAIIVIIAVFLGPSVGLLVFKAKILTSIILAFVGGLIAFILIMVALFVLRYGVILIVLEDKGLASSIAASYKLLTQNLIPTIIIHILLAISSLILSCGYILVFLILLIPLALVAIILWLILHYLTIPVMLVLIITASLAIAAVTAGLISAFESTAWTLTYKQLRFRRFKLK